MDRLLLRPPSTSRRRCWSSSAAPGRGDVHDFRVVGVHGNARDGAGDVAGPVTSIAVDPNDPEIMYIATAGGGALEDQQRRRDVDAFFSNLSTVQQLTIGG